MENPDYLANHPESERPEQYDDDPRSAGYPFEEDVSWREEAKPCDRCGEPLYGEVAEVAEGDRHLIIHQGCMREDEEIA